MTGPETFKGKIVCATGTFAGYTRQTLAAQLVSWGAVHTGTVTRNTDVLLVGDKPGGTKINQANKLGIQMMSQKAFMQLGATARAADSDEFIAATPTTMPDHYGSF